MTLGGPWQEYRSRIEVDGSRIQAYSMTGLIRSLYPISVFQNHSASVNRDFGVMRHRLN